MTCCISHIKHFIFPLGIAQVTYVVHIVLNMCNMYDTKAHLSKYIFSCSVRGSVFSVGYVILDK